MATTGKKKTAKTVETAETKLPQILDIPTAASKLIAEAAEKSININSVTMSIDGLEAYVNETLPNYAPDKYTGDADAAKKDRAVLNGGLKQIADARKQIIAKAMEPYKLLETRMKNPEKQMQTGSDALDAIVKAKENEEKDAKRKIIEQMWSGMKFTLVDLASVFDNRWLNKTYDLTDVQKDMTVIVGKIESDIKTIEGMSADPSEVNDLKAMYLDTRDLGLTVQRAQTMKANREKARQKAEHRAEVEHHEQIVTQMHDECTEYFEQQKAQPSVTLAAEVLGVEPDTDPVETYTLEFTGKKSALIAMRTYMSEHGITYKKLETEGAY